MKLMRRPRSTVGGVRCVAGSQSSDSPGDSLPALHAVGARRGRAEAELFVEFRRCAVSEQMDERSCRRAGVEFIRQSFHNAPSDASALMVGVDRHVRNEEEATAIADDPPHTDRLIAPHHGHAEPCASKSMLSRLGCDLTQAAILPQPTVILDGRRAVNQSVLILLAGVHGSQNLACARVLMPVAPAARGRSGPARQRAGGGQRASEPADGSLLQYRASE